MSPKKGWLGAWAEFDLESPFTRESLTRVPMDKFSWKPHERSMTLGWLATFITLCPQWGVMTIQVARDVR